MVIVIMTSNNRVTQHCIRYGKRCSCRAGSKTCPRDPRGKRIIDQFSEGVAHESKVGYQSLTKRIKSQIQKDAELIETKAIDGSTWHFFESPVTGKDGPSKPLMDELKKNDIIVEIHK